MISQTIVIAVPLEDELLAPLREWGRKYDFTHVSHIHLIHVVKKTVTPLEFGLVESPDEFSYHEMKPTLYKFLKDESSKIIPSDFKGKLTFEVTKDFEPEAEVIDILKKLNADLIVVSTHGRHGFSAFFHSSFTDYMIKHAPCDVFVVRPSEVSLPKSA